MLGTETTLARAPVRSKSIIASTTVSAATVSTTETLLTPASTVTFDPNTVVVGDVLRVAFYGRWTSSGTPPTIRLRVRWGGLAGTVLADTSTMSPFVSVTDGWWKVEGLITVRSVGAAGTLWPMFDFTGPVDVGLVIAGILALDGSCSPSPWVKPMAASSPAELIGTTAAVTVDTTTSKDLALTVLYSANTAANTITLDQVLVTKVSQA